MIRTLHSLQRDSGAKILQFGQKYYISTESHTLLNDRMIFNDVENYAIFV